MRRLQNFTGGADSDTIVIVESKLELFDRHEVCSATGKRMGTHTGKPTDVLVVVSIVVDFAIRRKMDVCIPKIVLLVTQAFFSCTSKS